MAKVKTDRTDTLIPFTLSVFIIFLHIKTAYLKLIHFHFPLLYIQILQLNFPISYKHIFLGLNYLFTGIRLQNAFLNIKTIHGNTFVQYRTGVFLVNKGNINKS